MTTITPFTIVKCAECKQATMQPRYGSTLPMEQRICNFCRDRKLESDKITDKGLLKPVIRKRIIKKK